MFESFVDDLKKREECDIRVMEIPAVDISSSEIRERIAKGKSISDLVPKNVEKYISDNELYK